MATVRVGEQNFANIVKEGTVLLDLWAPWCGPCRAFAPVYEAAAARHPGVTFGKVDVDQEPRIAAALRVRAIPTIVVIRDGVVVSQREGVLGAAGLDELVQKASALDMQAVLRSFAGESRGTDAGGV